MNLNEHFETQPDLYEMSYDNFLFSLEILKDWRTRRYSQTCERVRKMFGESVDNPVV